MQILFYRSISISDISSGNKSKRNMFTQHFTSLSLSACVSNMLFQLTFQVSFSSRIPVAFPTGDANSLSKNILMYACTLADGGSAGAGEQGREVQHVSHSASASAWLGSPALTQSSQPHPGICPAVMMVSKHVDGSLNQVREQT